MSSSAEDSNPKKRKASEMSDEELADLSKEELIRRNQELQDKVDELQAKIASGAAVSASEESDFSDADDDVSVVDPKDRWEIMFRQLRAHRIIHGRCTIMKEDNCDQKFVKWVMNQRFLYQTVKLGKSGPKISNERIIKLDSIDMFWGKKFPPVASWDDRFEELKKYKACMGKEPLVQKGLQNPQPLSTWVSTQRTEYRRFKKQRDSLLTLEQIQRLKEIKFDFKGPRL